MGSTPGILDEGNKGSHRTRNTRHIQLFEDIADHLDNLDVSLFTATAYVVDLTHAALLKHKVYGLTVVLNIEPITDVFPFSVHRKGFPMEGISDHEGDELLRELIGAIVVGASGYDHWDAIGLVVGPTKQIGCSFTCRIGGVGKKRGFLGEASFFPQGPIDLIGGDLDEPVDWVFPRGLKEHLHPFYVSLDEGTWVEDAPVHMGFGGKVYDRIRPLLGKDSLHKGSVGDVSSDEFVAGI